MEKQPNEVTRRVALSKAHRATPVGIELIALLTDLSNDGVVTRDEMAHLRAWLEVDRSIDFPACPFLHEIIETISSDGEITEEELDTLALAIERVLPPDIRRMASDKRKLVRTAQREARAVERQARSAAIAQERERAKPLHRGDYIVAGAMRSGERRDACEGLAVDEHVLLEREPDNRHDKNAILILTEAGDELGYVPREDARAMAPLLDAGGWADATVKKLLTTNAGHTLPVVVSKLYRQGVERPQPSPRVPAPVVAALSVPAPKATLRAVGATQAPVRTERRGHWVLAAVVLALMLAAYLLAG